MAVPSPRKLLLKLSLETVDKYKKWDCRNYENCLDTASDKNWTQFHCRDCKAYKKEIKPKLNSKKISDLYSLIDET